MRDDLSNEPDTAVDDKPDDGLVVAVQEIPAARDRRTERGGFLDM